MPKTISFHNGSEWSRGHNIRDERYTSKQEHINSSLSANNVTICDVPVRQAYDEIFGQAVEDYNDRQSRKDRKIDCYYDKIKHDKRKHPVYECIVQIGDCNDTGNNAELEKQALIRYAETWTTRNPNLHLVGAYIHCDEPDGTVHLHCDYIPIAECARGMSVQNSLDKALRQQGLQSLNINQTAQMAWQTQERNALMSICQELNIDVQLNQERTQGRKHLSTAEYKAERNKLEQDIELELQPLRDELQNYVELKQDISTTELQKRRIPFTKSVVVSADNLQEIEEQAKTYRVNRKNLQKMNEREQAIVDKTMALEIRENKIYEQENNIEQQYRELNEISVEIRQEQAIQKDLNGYLAKLEVKIELLEEELQNSEYHNERLKEKYDLLVSTINQERIAHNKAINECQVHIADKDKSIEELKLTIQSLQQANKETYESLTNIVKAVGMLKYDKGKYKVAGLSEEQSRLIDAIANYGAYWAEQDGFSDFAKTMQENIGISKGMQDFIDKLAPKKNRGRGGISL